MILFRECFKKDQMSQRNETRCFNFKNMATIRVCEKVTFLAVESMNQGREK